MAQMAVVGFLLQSESRKENELEIFGQKNAPPIEAGHFFYFGVLSVGYLVVRSKVSSGIFPVIVEEIVPHIATLFT